MRFFRALSKTLHALYHWTLAWAVRPSAAWALFGLAFLESSVFPIPPDVLLIPLVAAAPRRWLRYGTITLAASILGGILGYFLGFAFYETIGARIIDFYHAAELFGQIGARYEQYAFFTVFTAAFTPIPFKVITLSAGFFHINIFSFFAASFIGRGLRFFLIAGLLRLYGERIKRFIHRYFDALAILFTVLLIGGFVALKFFL